MAQDIIDQLRRIVGAGNVLAGDDLGRHPDRSAIWGTGQPCLARALVSPQDTAQVAAVMQACHRHRQSVVPFGGLTNLVKACITTPADIALSFAKMDRIEEVDRTAHTLTAQAGVTMQAAQDAAAAEDLFFPVDIGARGNCMLGGNVSTNAGGTRVIRYGMMRDSVLGLEAVLADGTIVSSMNRFLKNNSGFDLKQLFIGTEGVLGLVTRIVFRLQAMPQSHNVALLACSDYPQVVAILNKAKAMLGSSLCGFEVMWDNFFHEVVKPQGKLSSPLKPEHRYYIIVETCGADAESDDRAFEKAIMTMFESGLVDDGAIAKSDAEREAIWAIRHEVEWVVRDAHVFDISLPVVDVSEYVDTVSARLKKDIADARVAVFGHLGDNNIHISILCSEDNPGQPEVIERHIYESLRPYGGAISAEHGIGLGKKAYLPISRTEAEIELMRTLKRALDPANILNPGKVVSA